VVSEWSGGSHCCFTYHIFEIGNVFRWLDSIERVNNVVQFMDRKGGGNYRAILHDWTFQYWNASFGD